MSDYRVTVEMDGNVLSFTSDDCEKLNFATPIDVHIQGTPEEIERGVGPRILGQKHLKLTADFKPGKAPSWRTA